MKQYFTTVNHNIDQFHIDYRQTKKMYKHLSEIFHFFANELNDFIDSNQTFSKNTLIQNTNTALLMNMREFARLYGQQAEHLEEQHRVLKFYGKGLNFLKKEVASLEKDAQAIHLNL